MIGLPCGCGVPLIAGGVVERCASGATCSLHTPCVGPPFGYISCTCGVDRAGRLVVCGTGRRCMLVAMALRGVPYVPPVAK